MPIASYLEEQEKLEQEQAKPEITPPANNTNDERDLSETGIVGYLFDPNEKCFYTASDPWQRIVGYNELFDIFSEVAWIDFDTVRFKFDYKNKNWCVQIWKGQYGLLFYGAEIGVYNKPTNRKIAHPIIKFLRTPPYKVFKVLMVSNVVSGRCKCLTCIV